MPTSRNKSPNTSAHCNCAAESLRKIQHSQAPDRTLYSHREETKQDQLQYYALIPHSQSVPLANLGQVTPLLLQKDSPTSPMESEILKTRGVGYRYICLSRKKKNTNYSLSLRIGEIFSHKAISLAQLCGPFIITKEVFQAQDPVLVAQCGWMDYMHEIAFSNISIQIYSLEFFSKKYLSLLYLLNHLYQYEVIYCIILYHLHCCSNCPSFGHCELFQVGSCVLLACLCFLSISLLSGMTIYSRFMLLISPVPALESVLSGRSLGFCY